MTLGAPIKVEPPTPAEMQLGVVVTTAPFTGYLIEELIAKVDYVLKPKREG